MAEYRRGAHTVFEIRLYLVWIAKYRRAALRVRRRRAFGFDRDICGQHIDRDEDLERDSLPASGRSRAYSPLPEPPP